MWPNQTGSLLATVRAIVLVLVHNGDIHVLVPYVRIRRVFAAARGPTSSCSWYEYGSRDFAGRFGLDFSMAVVAVPFILYLVRFCSSKSCNTYSYQDPGPDPGLTWPHPLVTWLRVALPGLQYCTIVTLSKSETYKETIKEKYPPYYRTVSIRGY